MKIPVANIYYLLCYAWNKLQEKDRVAVDAEACNTLPDLFARVLYSGASYLLKKGLDRDYIEHEEALSGVKGKIDFSSSAKQNLLIRQKAWCRYDDMSYDVLHNQILKATIGRLVSLSDLDKEWREKLHSIYWRLNEISEIPLTPQVFGRVRIHQNNRFFEFLMRVCELLYHSLLPTEQSGRYKFSDFTKDDDMMAHVFEDFVRNFFRMEQEEYSSRREDISWQYHSEDQSSMKLLPKMQTDVSLRKQGRLIILECKYYRDVFDNRFGQDKLRSHNLYQIQTYLEQATKWEPPDTEISGVLLYATGYDSMPLKYDNPQGLSLTIRRLNLAQHWTKVREELLRVVE